MYVLGYFSFYFRFYALKGIFQACLESNNAFQIVHSLGLVNSFFLACSSFTFTREKRNRWSTTQSDKASNRSNYAVKEHVSCWGSVIQFHHSCFRRVHRSCGFRAYIISTWADRVLIFIGLLHWIPIGLSHRSFSSRSHLAGRCRIKCIAI